MPRYIITRVLYTLPVIWLVVSTVFLLIHFVPGDPIQQMLGEGAAAGDIQAARHAYGLDVPLGAVFVHPVAAGGSVLDLGGNGLEDVLHVRPRGRIASGHDRGSEARAFFAA